MAIWLPQMGGGKKIKDATATPADVLSGKVFYNNDGRQVGTVKGESEGALKLLFPNLKSYSFVIGNSGKPPYSSLYAGTDMYDLSDDHFGIKISVSGSSVQSIIGKKILTGVSYIVAVKLDNELFFTTLGKSLPLIFSYYNSTARNYEYLFGFSDGNVVIGQTTYKNFKNCVIYYVQ